MKKEEQEDQIYVLELRAIFLGLKALCGTESNMHIKLYCDNTSSCAYLQHLRGKEKIFEFISYLSYQLHCCTLPDKRCLSHCMLPLSGHDDVALF